MKTNKPTFLGATVLILGLILVLLGGFNIAQETPQNRWLTITGKVIDKQLIVTGQEHDEQVSTSIDDLPRNKETNFKFYPMVYYEYLLDDKLYQGELIEQPQLVYFSETNQSLEAERVLDEYKIGESVLIYYDPDNPATAVLVPHNNQPISKSIIPILFGFILIAFVVVQVVSPNPLNSSKLVHH